MVVPVSVVWRVSVVTLASSSTVTLVSRRRVLVRVLRPVGQLANMGSGVVVCVVFGWRRRRRERPWVAAGMRAGEVARRLRRLTSPEWREPRRGSTKALVTAWPNRLVTNSPTEMSCPGVRSMRPVRCA